VTFEDAFCLKDREVISLVGGGGKTALMFALGRELSARRRGVLLTTTTKIWDPGPSSEFTFFLSKDLAEIKEWVGKNLEDPRYLLIAQEKLETGKLQGIPTSWFFELRAIQGISQIIVEADGAAGRSLKAPREGEPVLPPNTTLLVPVVGIDALASPLNEQHVFRAKIAMEILKESEGAIINEEMIGRLLAATLKNRPEATRIIPFINKVDLPGGMEKGRCLARALSEFIPAKIERVILGQASKSPPLKEIVIRRETC
jgi:probable selenium-dependent hydroxylase accessory protein YqeC